ncbi:MAG TPA: aminopeptidase [bacterium]|nr:aminopeptidase [bacterium]
MADPRVTNLAKVLIRYSLEVKKGDWVRIEGPYNVQGLIRAAFAEVLAAGGYPTTHVSIPGTAPLFYKHATDEQLRFVAPTDKLLYNKVDKILIIGGGWNTKELTGIDSKRLSMRQKATRHLMHRLLERASKKEAAWVYTLFPTDSSAQDAEMSLEDYANFVFGAGLVDQPDPIAGWRKVSQRQAKLAKALGRLKTIRIVGKDTDITFGVAGRPWVNCDGKLNFPDGEVFTSPIESVTEGHIRYAFPAVYGGREVVDVRLTFKKGAVVKATAAKGEDMLTALLNTDPGAKRVGELSFGTNYSIKEFTKNTLFDEKIGGTMHVAVGDSLPDSKGKNRSAIHWDMVCDTRKGFTVYGDGKPIQRNGKFLI